MKKMLIVLGTIIISLVITFVMANELSLYHFGDVPTFTTISYLIFISCFLIYVLLIFSYLISKLIKKEKIGIKKIVSIILFFISLILVLGFMVVLNIDWITYYSNANSSPFYVFVLVRGIEFLLPSIILFIIGLYLLKRKDNK